MNLVPLAFQFQKVLSGDSPLVYLRCDPEVLDFTNGKSGSLRLYTPSGHVAVPLGDELTTLLGFLSGTVFAPEMTVICWNVKNLFSYLHYRLHAPFQAECNIFDLKVLEAFCDKRTDAPGDFSEAVSRLQAVFREQTWPKLKSLYRELHLPLIQAVIPALETRGLADKGNRRTLYSYYDIEGQVNGRLKCSLEYEHSFNPHSISQDMRQRLLPRQLDEVFVLFDFRHMEVSMLHWLSKDEHLGEVLALEEDLYKVIFKLVSGADCDNNAKREACKQFFLPVVYGMGANTLAEVLSLSLTTAESIIRSIYSLFPQALAWVQEAQQEAQRLGFCYDHFGRKRHFPEKQYRARDFVVQAPAAAVCLDKLVCLHKDLAGYAGMSAHIHDGYLLTTNRATVRLVVDTATEVLQADSRLCPGLKLKVICKFGRSLDALESYDAK